MEHASYYVFIKIEDFKGFLYYNTTVLASGGNYHQAELGLRKYPLRG